MSVLSRIESFYFPSEIQAGCGQDDWGGPGLQISRPASRPWQCQDHQGQLQQLHSTAPASLVGLSSQREKCEMSKSLFTRAEQSRASLLLLFQQFKIHAIFMIWNKIILKTANIHQILSLLPVLLGTTVQLSPKLYFTEARLMIDCCDYWKLGHLQWRKLNDQIQTPKDRQVDQLYRTGLHDPPRQWQGLHHHHWSHSIQQDFATAGKPQEYYWNIFKHFFFLL